MLRMKVKHQITQVQDNKRLSSPFQNVISDRNVCLPSRILPPVFPFSCRDSEGC